MRERLVHVQFRGTIRERSVEPFLGLFESLEHRSRVKGVLLDISSGGGGSVASMDLYLAVKRLDQTKPVFASIGALGASGGYMAALGARRIYAYPDSGVGSIGVVLPHVAVKGLLDRVGVEVELIHQGRHKDAYQGLRALTDEERTKLLAVTGDSYRGFVELVARERKRPVESIEPLATGEYWSGRKALELGLVDALGDRRDALVALGAAVGVSPAKTLRIQPHRPFLERLLSPGFTALGGSIRESIRDSIDDAVVEGLLRR